MMIIKRLIALTNHILSRWPAAIGGGYIRNILWRTFFAEYGGGIYFGDNLTILPFSRIKVGQGVSFMSGSYIYSNQGILTIGANTRINHNVFIGADGGEVCIGKNCLIGPNTVIRAANHKFSDRRRPILDQGHDYGKIIIGEDVWLGANVVVCANVQIGDGCVVGAGSIVTRDLPSMTICVGNPAKPIRER